MYKRQLHDGSTPAGAVVRMSCQTTDRTPGRRLAFYAVRLVTLTSALAFAPVVIPVMAITWLLCRQMPYDFI